MASEILTNLLTREDSHNFSAIVTCDIGQIVIDVTKYSDYYSAHYGNYFVVDYYYDKTKNRYFKTTEVDQLIYYIGRITKIVSLCNETCEEELIFEGF